MVVCESTSSGEVIGGLSRAVDEPIPAHFPCAARPDEAALCQHLLASPSARTSLHPAPALH